MSRSAFRNELAAAGRLAVPVVTSQLGLMLMGTVDTMMLGHLSAVALAAGALGNIFTYCLLNFGYGILSALDPLVSQAHGAEDAGLHELCDSRIRGLEASPDRLGSRADSHHRDPR